MYVSCRHCRWVAIFFSGYNYDVRLRIDVNVTVSDENNPWGFTGFTWTSTIDSKIAETIYHWNDQGKQQQHDPFQFRQIKGQKNFNTLKSNEDPDQVIFLMCIRFFT